MLVASEALPWLPWWAEGRVVWKAFLGVVILTLLGRVLLRRPTKVRATDESGRVVGYIGRMGSGKTYAAVRSAHAHLLAGCDVYTNFSMHLRHDELCPEDCELPVIEGAGKWRLIRTMDQVAGLRGEFEVVRGRRRCTRRFVIILDEVQDLLSSDHGKLSDTARYTIKNLRKFGGDLLWTSQSEGGVHARLKALTNQYGVCSSEKARGGRKFKVTYYDPETLRKPGKALFATTYRMEGEIGDLYDTSEIVVPESGYVDERLAVVLSATGIGDRATDEPTKEAGRRRAPIESVPGGVG
jgi:hypothetical protein